MNSNFKVQNIFIIAIAAIIVIVLIASNWKNNTDEEDKSSETGTGGNDPNRSEYDNCIESHKLKSDGEECAICVKPGHSEVYEVSVIVNGVCEAIVPNEFIVDEFTYHIKKGSFYKKNNIEAFKIDGPEYRQAYLKYRKNKIDAAKGKK